MKNEFKLLRDSAYTWDDRPHTYFDFSGRVIDKYGLPYIRSKLHFKYNYVTDKEENQDQIIGKFVDSLKNETVSEQPALNRFEHEDLHVVDMEVPANQYDTWVNSVPSKYFNEYKQKKLILDQYLSKFNSYERNQVIKIMCENSDSKNYVHFLDIDPDSMTTQQFLIYKDVIRFYEEIYLKEAVEQNKLWEQLSQRESELAKLNEPKAATFSLDDESEFENVDSQQLKEILSRVDDPTTSDVEQLRKQLDEMIAKTESMSETVEADQMRSSIQEPERGNNIRTLDIKPAKTLLFTPQTTVIGSKPFGSTKAYEPDYNKTLAQRGLNLSNTNIAKVGYVNNISDLINERNAKAAANQALVNEIIQNQIAYNNQFGGKISSGLKQSTTSYAPLNSGSKANAFNSASSSSTMTSTRNSMMSQNFSSQASVQASSPMNANRNSMMSQNFSSQASMQANSASAVSTARNSMMNQSFSSQAMSQQADNDSVASINKPLLIKKSNVAVNKPAQSYQSTTNTQQVIRQTTNFNFNKTNHTTSSVVAEPKEEVKTSIMNKQVQTKPIELTKPLDVQNKSRTQDVVGVYKINTKEIANEEPKKVLVGANIPTKKID